MTTGRFTRAQVEAAAREKYSGEIHMKALDEAMQEDTFEDAVELFICECEYLNKKGGYNQ